MDKFLTDKNNSSIMQPKVKTLLALIYLTITVFTAFNILKENDGEMRGKDVLEKIRETIVFNDYESHRYEKTGYVRWESILHFYTIDCNQ